MNRASKFVKGALYDSKAAAVYAQNLSKIFWAYTYPKGR